MADIPSSITVVPKLDDLPAEILRNIIAALLEDVIFSVEPSRTVYQSGRIKIWQARGLLFVCHRLRHEVIDYVTREKMIELWLYTPTRRDLLGALGIFQMHTDFTDSGHKEDSLRQFGSAAFVQIVTQLLPALQFFFLGVAIRVESYSKGRLDPMEYNEPYSPAAVAGLVRAGAYIVHRHPELCQLSFIDDSANPAGIKRWRKIELSCGPVLADVRRQHEKFELDNPVNVQIVLNATTIHRYKWKELIDLPMSDLAIDTTSKSSRLPDLPENQGWFGRVDEDAYRTATERSDRNLSQTETLDDLIEEARRDRDAFLTSHKHDTNLG